MKLKIHRHELSVALAKGRHFSMLLDSLGEQLYQEKKSREEEEEHKNKVHTKGNYRFDFITIREKKKILHRCHSQHKLRSRSPMKL